MNGAGNRPGRQHPPTLMVQAFPRPAGATLRLAFRELDIALNGTAEQRKALGNIDDLPRPWAPSTCAKPVLRTELWNWLEEVVTWLNHEMVFDPTDIVPPCWPRHPHLVHEIAVLADRRRRADLALTSDLLEDWHRYALPSFLDRMKHRIGEHCADTHPANWPAVGRFHRHLDQPASETRQQTYVEDINSICVDMHGNEQGLGVPRLRLVDETTGEVLDLNDTE